MKPYKEKFYAIVGPRGAVRHLCTTRRVALSQFGLHYAKPTRVVLSERHFKEVEAAMFRKGWSVQPVWMIVKSRRPSQGRQEGRS